MPFTTWTDHWLKHLFHKWPIVLWHYHQVCGMLDFHKTTFRLLLQSISYMNFISRFRLKISFLFVHCYLLSIKEWCRDNHLHSYFIWESHSIDSDGGSQSAYDSSLKTLFNQHQFANYCRCNWNCFAYTRCLY